MTRIGVTALTTSVLAFYTLAPLVALALIGRSLHRLAQRNR